MQCLWQACMGPILGFGLGFGFRSMNKGMRRSRARDRGGVRVRIHVRRHVQARVWVGLWLVRGVVLADPLQERHEEAPHVLKAGGYRGYHHPQVYDTILVNFSHTAH